MKQAFLLFFLIVSVGAFSQTDILDSIEQLRKKNVPELGESLCTPDYWISKTDGGIAVFNQICSWGDRIDLKLQDEQKHERKAVITVDMYIDGKPRDRFYVYLIKESDFWLIDGINETEHQIKLFLEGLYSGHFSPLDLPTDNELEEFGEKILSFGRNETDMISFLEENTAPSSEIDFTSQMTTDMNFELHIVKRVGYEERTNVGFIYFTGQSKDDVYYYSEITIYVSKTESGKIKILDRGYGGPYASDFFYNLK